MTENEKTILRTLGMRLQEAVSGKVRGSYSRIDGIMDPELQALALSVEKAVAALNENKGTVARLMNMCNLDPLTSLSNRAHFNEKMDHFDRSRRFPVTIIIADIDGLKMVNAGYGHAVGDRLIQAAAQIFREAIRVDDVLARIGGDEFAFLLPETSLHEAAVVIERIREYESTTPLYDSVYHLRVSLGVATAESRGDLGEIFKIADQRMQEDKLQRRSSNPAGR